MTTPTAYDLFVQRPRSAPKRQSSRRERQSQGGLPATLTLEELWNERVMVALPETHPLAVLTESAWEQLAKERFIVSRVDPGPEIEDYIIRGLAELGRHPEVEQIPVQRETLLGLAGLGQGLSLVGEAEAGVFYPGVMTWTALQPSRRMICGEPEGEPR